MLNFGDSGWKLEMFEIYNWGTFTDKIWKLDCGGATSLLTGANGSGKSTLVDGLLTLLVPSRKRAYNQASGAATKRGDRDESSYVLGVYGKVRDESAEFSRVQQLRSKNNYSVLLARFIDTSSREVVGLAQFFWFDQGVLHKFFVVSTAPLSIEADFMGFENAKDLKKRLKERPNTESFSHFSDYSARFRRLLGLSSETALDLFSQTVSLKAISDLNDFIRAHMLERVDVQDRIEELKKNYENLDRTYKSIQRAREQIVLLTPLIQNGDRYDVLSEEERSVSELVQMLPGYIASKKLSLLSEASSVLEAKSSRNNDQLSEIADKLTVLRATSGEQKAALEKDEAATRIRGIEQEIRHLEETVKSREKRQQEFQTLLARIDIKHIPGEEEFYGFHSSCPGELAGFEEKRAAALSQRDALMIERANLTDKEREDQRELSSLEVRKTQIPERNLLIRREIANNLEIAEESLPFVGEIIRVKNEEAPWEGAIERVLKNFGLRMLVPEKHYARVNQFVSQTYLKGKIVYHRVDTNRGITVQRDLERDSLAYKVEVKAKTEFTSWVQQEIESHFDYVCTDDLLRFQREKRAVTSSGLVKSGMSLHEKNDRTHVGDRREYILGWDNREKIALLRKGIEQIQNKVRLVDQKILEIHDIEKAIGAKIEAVKRLLEFTVYSEIDVAAPRFAIEALRVEYEALLESSQKLQKLREALEKTEREIRNADSRRDELLQLKGALENERNALQREERESRQVLASYHEAECLRLFPMIDSSIDPKTEWKLASVQHIHATTRAKFDAKRNKLERERQSVQSSIISAMAMMKQRYPEESGEVDAAIESLPGFRSIQKKIEHEDLPRHEQRFKDLLNENVIRDVAHFKSCLEEQELEIRERVAGINKRLRAIRYSTATFIRLIIQLSQDTEVREFRRMLLECLPDIGAGQKEDLYTASFEKVKALIEKLDTEERWAHKVTDVRNWLTFSASEIYEADGAEKGHYSDSGGLSGGQKAKLAYTILASAIAYQYGLGNPMQSRSFRFVVVDEAFSKSDETNARYAMDLFKTLNLQLLLVTPLDKIHVAEPYISACHYIDNNESQNYSRVFNLTISEYHEQKKNFSVRSEALTDIAV